MNDQANDRKSQIPERPVLAIDSVAEYFYSGIDQEYWKLRDLFPNLRRRQFGEPEPEVK
jgi:isochorismate hydrolase